MKSLSSGYLISSALIWLDGAHVPDRKFSGGGNNGIIYSSLVRCGGGEVLNLKGKKINPLPHVSTENSTNDCCRQSRPSRF